jgi:CBS domain-containing protein
MKVKEIMNTAVTTCDLNASLADAARTMWKHDCGILPVLKDGRELVGLITDRDICMASAMKRRDPTAISVEEVITGKVFSVMTDDDVKQALEVMQQRQVRRLPVVDAEGNLSGVLSMNDVVLNAAESDSEEAASISYDDVVRTYKAICRHPLPMAATATAG